MVFNSHKKGKEPHSGLCHWRIFEAAGARARRVAGGELQRLARRARVPRCAHQRRQQQHCFRLFRFMELAEIGRCRASVLSPAQAKNAYRTLYGAFHVTSLPRHHRAIEITPRVLPPKARGPLLPLVSPSSIPPRIGGAVFYKYPPPSPPDPQ